MKPMMASALQFNRPSGGLKMKQLLKNIFFFRVGQKAARGIARTVGLKKVAEVIGLVGGYRHMRRHAQ
jgi:hypothetical protein